MRRYLALFFIIINTMISESIAGKINLGVGFDYFPVARLQYVNNRNADFDIVDNIAWQGRASYSLGNGFQGGLIFEYYGKRIHPNPSTTTELSQWNLGLVGNYGYAITETGHMLLVAGIEAGYGELTDNSNTISMISSSPWIAGLAGTRFMIASAIWFDVDYRIGIQDFNMNTQPVKKYLFTGSSLRLSLDLPIYSTERKTGKK